jgi:hypothetical protein
MGKNIRNSNELNNTLEGLGAKIGIMSEGRMWRSHECRRRMASRGQLALRRRIASRGSDGRGLQVTRATGVARANSFARVLRTRVASNEGLRRFKELRYWKIVDFIPTT